jgi:hypothetical protein
MNSAGQEIEEDDYTSLAGITYSAGSVPVFSGEMV